MKPNTNTIPMTKEHASQISKWKYEDIYSFYDQNEDNTDEYMDGTHYACLDENNELIGYFCFGKGARVPTVESDAYGEDYLDIGLGLRPDLCGKGLGVSFFNKGLRFAREVYKPVGFRLSVAAFNERAVKVYERAGFKIVREVTNSYFQNKFYIMTSD